MRKILVSSLLSLNMAAAYAAVNPAEAEKLGGQLTPFGAERAGNAERTIPEYTGGLRALAPGFKPGTGRYEDPFSSERPLYSVTAANMQDYASVLTEGSKALLQKYPSFRVDVYPTHRTVSYPKDVQDSTRQCATQARLTDEVGSGFSGGFNCVLFPIPQNGMEVIWNHRTRLLGKHLRMTSVSSYFVTSEGRAVLASTLDEDLYHPFYDTTNRAAFDKSHFFYQMRAEYTSPARRVGEMLLVKDPDNDATIGRKSWVYLPGQRRVRMAPDVGHDTPNPTSAGMTTYDDNQFGSLERFDWKLVGKKEMLIPYNNYKALFGSSDREVLTPNHVNPDILRWELHRVWVVEGTLKKGQRHVYSKRRYYIDEDSWAFSAAESYDAHGALWRVPLWLTIQSYDVGLPFSGFTSFYHDLNSSTWSAYLLAGDSRSKVLYPQSYPNDHFSAEELAGSGVR